jgi:hypothetical protein
MAGAKVPESAIGSAGALSWKTYGVKRADKALLLKFIVDGLQDRGCKIVSTTDPAVAPFFIVTETPSGERQAILAYAFTANSKLTKNRPEDEHRFQIKYGGQLEGILDVKIDENALITTIFLGIDLERGVFVAADPVMNSPSPMSRSIEFKSDHVEEVLKRGWFAWERPRHPPKTKNRPAAELDIDTRTEVLVGGTRDKIIDLVALEKIAWKLDPGERHLLADTLVKTKSNPASHKLLDELGVDEGTLLDLIDGASRLKMAVRGWVAEQHLEDMLKTVRGVSDCFRLNEDGKADISLRWKGSAPFLIECKNVLRKPNSAGNARIDFQRTRAAKSDPCSRYYSPSDFAILAACLHAISEHWEFRFTQTKSLKSHATCNGKLASAVVVTDDLFTSRPETVFDALLGN